MTAGLFGSWLAIASNTGSRGRVEAIRIAGDMGNAGRMFRRLQDTEDGERRVNLPSILHAQLHSKCNGQPRRSESEGTSRVMMSSLSGEAFILRVRHARKYLHVLGHEQLAKPLYAMS